MWQQEKRDIEREERFWRGEATFGEWCGVVALVLLILSPAFAGFACLFLKFLLL